MASSRSLRGNYSILECAAYRLLKFRMLMYRPLNEVAATDEVADEVVVDEDAGVVIDVVEMECDNFCQRLTVRLAREMPKFDKSGTADIVAYEVAEFEERLIRRLLNADHSSDASSGTVVLSDGQTAVFLDSGMESDDDFYQRRYGC